MTLLVELGYVSSGAVEAAAAAHHMVYFEDMDRASVVECLKEACQTGNDIKLVVAARSIELFVSLIKSLPVAHDSDE